ncbi:Na/Pi cotransporter family protein [Neobacillus piezotolerans]|uniref:Na/Pi cotransporter family protein n=1 Tax=Neobacillus piezotolerans TaxID=2259171 RepID=A0A3D8GMX6_9BACI|nr:Na/Pi symporter [Neobacillus piezotolerans]RDU35426.1 Na/Pi cotransporter family protein [Neobacillus piezotolerans]
MKYIVLFCLCIGLFIFGMTIIRIGMFNISGNRLKGLLQKLTSTPLKGMATGTLVTAVLQSSSTVMVLAIGLISAKILTFPQSIGIILGTNIGTTFKTELITFDLGKILIPVAVAGGIFILARKVVLRSTGMVLLGIASVFTAMKGFEALSLPLASVDAVHKLLLSLNEHILVGIAAGACMTAIIQSSTAMTGIAMGFLTSGILGLEAGIAVMLGANIGTCITALIAAIGGGEEAKLAAFAHVWLNVIGVLLFIPLIPVLGNLGPEIAGSPDVQLAHISVIFNVSTSLLALPFAERFGRMIMHLHGK